MTEDINFMVMLLPNKLDSATYNPCEDIHTEQFEQHDSKKKVCNLQYMYMHTCIDQYKRYNCHN